MTARDKIGGSDAAHEASGRVPGADVSSRNSALHSGDAAMQGAFSGEASEAYAAGVAAGRAQATREMVVRLNQMRVDLVAASLGGARLAGNSEGVGAVPAADAREKQMLAVYAAGRRQGAREMRKRQRAEAGSELAALKKRGWMADEPAPTDEADRAGR